MHGYRLTVRGKFVLTMLFILSLTSMLNPGGIAIASDKSEYVISNVTYLSSSPAPELCKLNLSESAAVFKNETDGLKETEKDSDLDDKGKFLSINVEDIRSYDKSKVAFLTFDDGPSENVTPLILDVLDRYHIKATFFVLGGMSEKNGIVLNDIRNRGHSIGIHSYSHNYSKVYKNKDSFVNELKMTENVLKQNLGQDFSTRLFRFPGGSFEDYKKQYIKVLNENGYVSVDWNAVTGDAEFLNPTPEMLLKRLKATVKNKKNIVLLMHDSATKQASAQVLPDVIEYLKAEGYEFAVLK